MDLNLTGNINFLNLFFKAFALIFSVLYFFYAIVITKQTQVMNSTLTVGRSTVILFFSFLHILVAIALIALAVFTV